MFEKSIHNLIEGKKQAQPINYFDGSGSDHMGFHRKLSSKHEIFFKALVHEDFNFWVTFDEVFERFWRGKHFTFLLISFRALVREGS